MSKRSLLLLVAVISLGVIFQPHEAGAVAVGQSCSSPGATGMLDDQRNAVMCLSTGSGSFVWKQLSVEPQSIANSQGQPVAHFEDSGGVVWNAPAPNSPAQSAATRPLLAQASPESRWSGWYVGGNVGFANTTDTFTFPNHGDGSGESTDFELENGTAGLVAGYNWVRSGGAFYGAEADINYMGNAGHQFSSGNDPAELKSDWYGYATARGRVGLALDSAVVFVTGGLALADVRDAECSACDGTDTEGTGGVEVGWTAGAGSEFALTDNISMSLQYLRLEMGESVVPSNGVNFGKLYLDDSADIFRLGVNWHFE
jgi:outer membrane immunogenic protein